MPPWPQPQAVEATEHVVMVRRSASQMHAAKAHGQDEALSMRGERRHDWPLDVTWTAPDRSSHMIRREEVRDRADVPTEYRKWINE